MSKGGDTTTVQQQTNPLALSAYGNSVATGTNVAAQPYQTYDAPLVAGFNPTQTAAFNNISSAAGAAQPYIGQAAGLINQSTSGIDPAATVGQYMSPYTSSVVQGLTDVQNQQDAQQQEQLAGQAIGAGAFGGDRAQIAQSVLAGQQKLGNAPAIANALQSGYTQALQTGLSTQQANAWLASQGAFALGNLGNEAQSTALSGAGAQLQAGNQQQQQAQMQLGVPYSQFQQAQSYPFTISNFLSGLASGAGGAGGTTTQTAPGPSAISQATGLGFLGLGAYNAGAFNGVGDWLSGAGSTVPYSSLSDLTGEAVARGGGIGRAFGGHVGGLGPVDAFMFPHHFDDGGALPIGLGTSPGVSGTEQAMLGSGDPRLTGSLNEYSALPTEKLRELSVRLPPGSTQGALVQSILHRRIQAPESEPAQAPMAGLGALPGLQPMASGGAADSWLIDPGGLSGGVGGPQGAFNGTGFGDNPNGTARDMWNAVSTGAPMVLGGFTGPLGVIGLGGKMMASAATGNAPSLKTLWDFARNGADDPGGLSGGKIDISPGNTVSDIIGGFSGLGDITNGGGPSGDRMSGNGSVERADGSKGEESYGPGGAVEDDPFLAPPALDADSQRAVTASPDDYVLPGDDDLPLPPEPEPAPGLVRLPPMEVRGRAPTGGGSSLPLPPDYVPPPDDGGDAPVGLGEAPARGGRDGPSFVDRLTTGNNGALLAAGLGILAGRSPHAAVNIGQGGLSGLNFAQQERQRLATNALKFEQAQWNRQYQQGRLDNSGRAIDVRAQHNDDLKTAAMIRALHAAGAGSGGHWSYAGVDGNGMPLLLNSRDGSIRAGDTAIAPKPADQARIDGARDRLLQSQDARTAAATLKQQGMSDANARAVLGRAVGIMAADLSGKTKWPDAMARATAGLQQARDAVAPPAAAPAPAAPHVGDVLQGYRFLGGNPADQSSWAPQ